MNPKKYLSRISSSQRGRAFNPLIWPFLISTFAYGTGFAFFTDSSTISKSSLYLAMRDINPVAPYIWGGIALATIVMGITFLLYNIPPAGKASGLIGFMLWVFASFCWGFDNGWLLIFSIAVPNLYFWFWQYLSLSEFRREDAEDKNTMIAYDAGEYDDDNGGKNLRESNRGVDRQ
jgi:hypothetical protein